MPPAGWVSCPFRAKDSIPFALNSVLRVLSLVLRVTIFELVVSQVAAPLMGTLLGHFPSWHDFGRAGSKLSRYAMKPAGQIAP